MKKISFFTLTCILNLSLGTAPFLISSAYADGNTQKDVPPSSSQPSNPLAQQAATFIQDLGHKATSLLISKSITEAERTNRFKVLFNENFAVDAIGKFCLGRYWRTTNDQERKEYLELFDDSVAKSYASKFAQYDPKNVFEVISTRTKEDNGIVVKSRLIKPEGDPINIDWVLYSTPQGLKIFDVVVEGISMSVTQRSEYGSIIQRNGGSVSGLIKALRDKKTSASV